MGGCEKRRSYVNADNPVQGIYIVYRWLKLTDSYGPL